MFIADHSPPSCPSPDLIRGLSRASTAFLRRSGKQDVDGRDIRAFTPVFDGLLPGHDESF
jgi:hypothetical protein